MRVSIAVPSRNHGRFLWRCLQSIATQDHADFEVLIADGGSTDDSSEIIAGFVRQDGRFRLVSTSDAGQADAVNRALREGTGDIACFLNADDEYLERDVLRRIVNAFATHPDIDVVTCGGSYLDANGRRLRPVRLRYHPLDKFVGMRRRIAVLQPATFWRRAITARFPFRADLHFAFDHLFFYQLLLEYRWLELPDRIAGYRLHGANKSLMISSARVTELVELEAVKYGAGTFRPAYLRLVALVTGYADHLPRALQTPVKRLIYLIVNSLSFLTVYRLPGI